MMRPEMIIQFTPVQIVTLIFGICALVTAVNGTIGVLSSWLGWVKKPEKNQNARIDMHEERLCMIEERIKKHDQLFVNDKGRLDAMDEGNKVTQKALLALLSHAIDGNNIEPLKKAKEDLQEYLIER